MSLVHPRTAAGGERPQDILSVINVNVVADEHESVDGLSGFLVEDEVADPLPELGTVGLHTAEFGGVHAQSYPCDLGFKR